VIFLFGLIFTNKNNQHRNKKNNQNRTETGSNRLVLVRFGFLCQKKIYIVFLAFWTEKECLDGLLYYPFFTQPRAFTHPNKVEPSLPFLGSLHLLDTPLSLPTFLNSICDQP
jgi:hypothetical protein